MKTKALLGYAYLNTGGTYHIAVCENCRASVIMNQEQRYSTARGILDFLSFYMDCCNKPDYSFYSVVQFADVSRKCPTCGQLVKEQETEIGKGGDSG